MTAVLFVSNGHGEAAIAERIAVELAALLPALRLDHLALVGDVPSESLRDVGPRAAMPSGGLIAMGNVRNIARDVRAGLLGLTLAQRRFLRNVRGEYAAAVAVGDAFALLMALQARAPSVFVGTAKSVNVAPYGVFEERLLRRAAACFVRDAPTAERLELHGLHVEPHANVIADIFATPDDAHAERAVEGFSPAIALFPGSRAGAYAERRVPPGGGASGCAGPARYRSGPLGRARPRRPRVRSDCESKRLEGRGKSRRSDSIRTLRRRARCRPCVARRDRPAAAARGARARAGRNSERGGCRRRRARRGVRAAWTRFGMVPQTPVGIARRRDDGASGRERKRGHRRIGTTRRSRAPRQHGGGRKSANRRARRGAPRRRTHRRRRCGRAMLKRPLALGFAAVYAALPLYPAFIVLTSVTYPGVSIVPKPLALGVLALVGVLVAYSSALLVGFRVPRSQPLLLPMLAMFGAATLAALVGFDPLRGLLFVGIFGIEHLMALFSAAILPRTRRGTSDLLGIPLDRHAGGGGGDRHGRDAYVPASLYALQHGRATGTFVLPGELAAYLIVMLPVAYAATRAGTTSALRALAWTAIAIGLAALVLTFSRAGWMGAAAAAAFLVAARSRGNRHGRVVALFSIVAGVLAVLLLFNSHHDPSEDYTRIGIWQAALQIIDRFPLTGVGPFDFPLLYALVHVPDADATAFHAHSLYLTFFAEGGILMLAAFAWLAWTFVAELRARLSRAPASPVLALAVAAGLVGIAVQGLIDTMSIAIFGLWLPAMGLALAAAGPKKPSAGDRQR